ncbi:GNAT family N-acetyltransferase [Rapidithrix thailandica]|uniref:GNAT family N-acetyltransferase n=1 Tax=Rapidithrix thailandica TaxID=413964 RepID=A0AAW9SA68_9BACT
MKPSKEELFQRLVRIGGDLSLSAGAFYKEQLVGFILTGTGIYQGKPTAYNAGTGVLPGFRGNHLTEQLYTYLWEKFPIHNIQQCLLEVITTNQRAIAIYHKLGFVIHRTYECYVNTREINAPAPLLKIKIHLEKAERWEELQSFWDTTPSWQNSWQAISQNSADETILIAKANKQIVGYLSFLSDTGRVSQIAVLPDYRRMYIGWQLLQTAQKIAHPLQKLSFINIDQTYGPLHQFLKRVGFQNPIAQYEMIKTL